MSNHVVDFSLITRGEVRNISGHERGVEARKLFELDELDLSPEPVTVFIPESIDAITSSFLQGLLAKSVRNFNSTEEFFHHYKFNASSLIMQQIMSGIEKINTTRYSAFDH